MTEMDEIPYNFEQFPKRLQARIKKIATEQACSIDEAVQGLWGSFLAMVDSGQPELTGFAKIVQDTRYPSGKKPPVRKGKKQPPTKPKGKK